MNYFERMMRGEAEPPTIFKTLGGAIRSVDTEAGTLEIDFVGGEAFLNPAGQIQGGILGSMLDDVTGMLVTSLLEEGVHCASLNLAIVFLRPARPGAIQARATLLRRGRDVFHVQSELRQDDKVVATATSACLGVPSKR